MIAILALKSEIVDQTHEIGDRLRELLGEDTIVRLGDDGITTIAEVAGVVVKVSRRDHPIPNELLDGPIENAWYWPEARQVFLSHASHLIVICQKSTTEEEQDVATSEMPESGVEMESAAAESAPLDSAPLDSAPLESAPLDSAPPLDEGEIGFSVQRALLLTRVSQVLGDAFAAVGVYWDSSTTIHAWPAFVESCQSMTPDRLPLRIWIDFRLWEATDGTRGLATRGLCALGQRELEVIGSTSSAEQVRAWSYTVAHYCLEQTQILKHGQAVGVSASEWVRAWVVESRLEPGTWATWLDLEAEE
ncbi:MAG: DUF4261 domain-containing protein [Planctomycetes bacterium]|jgi:hypothetical protein|nr:DUF4261 domain-containing protein [Planctomycetota bacterium]MBT6968179.1 DUF4261 domain-containing protein [Planctomycetota bacterium]MBT7130606.1 DUF4261 domain-containing protein [Planctomycetota bacterium]